MSQPALTPAEQRAVRNLQRAQHRESQVKRRLEEIDRQIASLQEQRAAFATDLNRIAQMKRDSIRTLRGGPNG